MTPLPDLPEHPIDPIYAQSRPNEAINLGEVRVQFEQGGTAFDEPGTATLQFLPAERLRFVCQLDGDGAWLRIGDIAHCIPTLMPPASGAAVEVYCTSIGGEHNEIIFAPLTSGVMVTSPTDAISSATFHLLNFPVFFGLADYIVKTGEPPYQGSSRHGRVVLEADGWSITIAETDATQVLAKGLSAQGGYVLTHVGQIKRADGSTFTSDGLEDVLTCLHYFLSFALGRWAGVALPVGFDQKGFRVFEQWGSRITADGAWEGSSSWFDAHHADLLPQVFTGFRRLWTTPLWQQSLRRALYWYLAACHRGVGIGVDTGMILAQTALELLAWTYCVLDRRMISRNAFQPRGLAAADKLRLLASSLGIPLLIPQALSTLHNRPGRNWADGMDAITAIRNAIVHPDGQPNYPAATPFYEGWKLSLWYIDLILLRLCGHSGQYANRLVQRYKGQVEAVPWA